MVPRKLPSDCGCAKGSPPNFLGVGLYILTGPCSQHLESCISRHVLGPDLGLGAPEIPSSQPNCQTSSVLSALALDPLILSCPVLHLPQGAKAAVPYSFVLPLLRNLALSHGPGNPILSSFVA